MRHEWLDRWRRRGRVLLRKRDVEREMDDEMRFHIEMEAAEIARTEGVPLAQARRRAVLLFGGTDRTQEAAWEARGVRPLDDLMMDVRYGLRWLRRTPGFALVAVLTLALGAGVTTAIFSVVSGLLLRPLPYEDADGIVLLGEAEKTSASGVSSTSYPNFADWQARSTSFEAMALYDEWLPAYTGGGEPERVKGVVVTAGIFDIFRIRPHIGRAVLAADNVTGSEPVILVSYSFWHRRLQGDKDIIGRTILLNGRPQTVIGVLPQEFRPPEELDADFWGNTYFDSTDTRTSRYLRAIGRLKPGVSAELANRELGSIAAQLETMYPAENRGMTARAVPLREELVGDVRGPVLALFGAAFFVLLIVCANLVNLLLARATARTRELSIRAALGADRFRTVRQLLTESAILVVLGGSAGIVLAFGVTALLKRAAPPVISTHDIAVDGGVIAFTCGLVLLVTLLVGVFPALRGSQQDPQQALKDGGRSTEGGRRMRTRAALVAAQLALALTLLVGAGLLIRSVAQLNRIDPGVREDNVLAMSINLPAASYPAGQEPAFFRELITRVEALPGVRSAAVTSILPFGGSWDRIGIDFEGVPVAAGTDKPEADRYIVSPQYFAAMDIHLVAGRLFDDSDTYDRPLVAVVDEVFARRIAPDGNAIGMRTRLPARDSLATVVGIVRHVKHYGLDKSSNGQIYMAHEQYPWRWMNLVVHTAVEPLPLGRTVRDVVWSLDRNQPVFGITTMRALMAERAAVRQFVLVLLAAFAAIALLVAAVGLYGVIAYTVAQRRQEIGIRIALGARSSQVVRLVLKDAMLLAVIGAIAGLAGAVAGARLLSGLLFAVGTADPAVLATVTTVLLAVALLASYVPARRAARVSVLQALRSG